MAIKRIRTIFCVLVAWILTIIIESGFTESNIFDLYTYNIGMVFLQLLLYSCMALAGILVADELNK